MTVFDRTSDGTRKTAVRVSTQTGRVARVLSHPVVRIVVPLRIVALTGVVLHRMAADVQWAVTNRFLALASYDISHDISYDILGVRSAARGLVPACVASYSGATGFAISNLLGFSWLTGTAVR